MASGNVEQAHPDGGHIYTDDEIDLRQLARAVWRYRWIVILMGVIGGVSGVGVGLFNTKYVSEGLFLVPSITVASLKQYEAALGNLDRLSQFIELQKLQGTQSAEILEKVVETPGALAKSVRPAFALTGSEAKAYGIDAIDAGIVGISLTVERNELTDESPIQVLADYLRHTIIQVDLRDVTLEKCSVYSRKEQELRNDQIQSAFTTRQLRDRAATVRRLMDTIPGAAAIDNRQVISLEGGGERFLSPASQFVALEVSIAEAVLADEQRERARISASLKGAYYCRAKDSQQKALTGQQLLRDLNAISEEVFAGRDLSTDIVEQTFNELALERQDLSARYLDRARFVVAPEGGEQKRRKPGLGLGGVLGGVVGGLIGLLVALSLAWWHDNRAEVLSVEDDQ